MKGYRVGIGFDVHRFSGAGKDLVLGGVKIPSEFGLEAVSDGDVVLHSLSDALCGACGLGDIGDYFPPDSKESKGINSVDIINLILSKMAGRFVIVNVDIIVVAEKPRLVEHKEKITESLRKIISVDAVNLKVKSKEETDILGGRDSMSCITNVLVECAGHSGEK